MKMKHHLYAFVGSGASAADFEDDHTAKSGLLRKKMITTVDATALGAHPAPFAT